MIYDVTYTDKNTIRKINAAVGPSFPFLDRIRLGGIGSPRMKIEEISEDYKKYMKADHYESKANIELRPQGILVHFRHKLESYAWVMPYVHLKITYDDKLLLESEGKFIRFSSGLKDTFIRKMMEMAEI